MYRCFSKSLVIRHAILPTCAHTSTRLFLSRSTHVTSLSRGMHMIPSTCHTHAITMSCQRFYSFIPMGKDTPTTTTNMTNINNTNTATVTSKKVNDTYMPTSDKNDITTTATGMSTSLDTELVYPDEHHDGDLLIHDMRIYCDGLLKYYRGQSNSNTRNYQQQQELETRS